MDRPFQDRSELVAFVGRQAPTPAIRRACVEGTIEVLGAFTRWPPIMLPCLAVRVTSIHRRTWYVILVPDEVAQKWIVKVGDCVPWRYWRWSEAAPAGADYSVYWGDCPTRYYRHQQEALNESARIV